MASGKEIKRLRESANISAADLAILMDVNPDRLRKWEQRDTDPRELDKIKVEAYFKVKLEELVKLDNFKFYSQKKIAANDTMNEEQAKYGEGDKSPPLKAIYNLTESNRMLAKAQLNFSESQLNFSESNKQLVQSNKELTQMMKVIVDKPIEHVDQQILEVFAASYPKLLELIAEIGEGKTWRTKEEGVVVLHKRLYGNLPKRRKEDSIAAAGK